MQIKVLIPSLTTVDMQEMEDKGILVVEEIGWHDNESLAPWKISTVRTNGDYELHREIWL